jgi:hypothetical protein
MGEPMKDWFEQSRVRQTSHSHNFKSGGKSGKNGSNLCGLEFPVLHVGCQDNTSSKDWWESFWSFLPKVLPSDPDIACHGWDDFSPNACEKEPKSRDDFLYETNCTILINSPPSKYKKLLLGLRLGSREWSRCNDTMVVTEKTAQPSRVLRSNVAGATFPAAHSWLLLLPFQKTRVEEPRLGSTHP